MSQPTRAKGNEYLITDFETGKSPAKRISTKGYMQILWYQQSTQGGYIMTSLKKRLPSVATQATTQALKIVFMDKQ